jgi:hypothetical protein
MSKEHTLGYRPVGKRSLCKQRSLLGNAHKMHAHNNRRPVLYMVRFATVSRQLFGKHLPFARHEILNNATVGLKKWKRLFLLHDSKQVTKSRSWVLYESLWSKDLSAWSSRITTARGRCQGTAGENTAGRIRLSVCCGDLWIMKISGGAVITCTYELCA